MAAASRMRPRHSSGKSETCSVSVALLSAALVVSLMVNAAGVLRTPKTPDEAREFADGSIEAKLMASMGADVECDCSLEEVCGQPSTHGADFLSLMGTTTELHTTVRLLRAKMFHRSHLGTLAESLGFKGHGAEVGVWTGLSAKDTLERWPSCSKFYLVDPYRSHKAGLKDKQHNSQEQLDGIFKTARHTLSAHEDRIEFVRNTSVGGASMGDKSPRQLLNPHIAVPDNSLDYLYVDARHDREFVVEDLMYWYPKVKEGGIVAGHDMYDVRGVTGGLFEYLYMHVFGTIDLVITSEQGSSWFFRKPHASELKQMPRKKYGVFQTLPEYFPDLNKGIEKIE